MKDSAITPLPDTGRRSLLLLLGFYVLLWTAARMLWSVNLDGYGDMLENYAWGQTFDWGSFKHPPLVGWVTGLWFRLLPENDHLYFLLSYLSAAVGLAGMYCLARAAGLGRLALAAVALQMFAFPYSTLAAKYNANSVLLPLWPWVAFLWWQAVHHPRRTWPALALGVVAALAMLGKYYSGVLLLSLGLLTLALPQGRRWLATPRPWLALLVLFAALAPHLAWLASHEFVTLRYVGEQGGGGVGWHSLAKFCISPLLYWGLALALCVALFGTRALPWWRRAAIAWRPTGWGDTLFWVAMLPFFITLLFGLSGVVELSLPWSIPLGFAFPVLWLRNLGATDTARSPALTRPLAALALVVLVAAGAEGWRMAAQGDELAYLPRREAARELLARWDARHPGQRPRWVGGSWAENAGLAFYGDASIRVIPGLPDQLPATLDADFAAGWPQQPGLLYCPPVVRGPAAQPTCEAEARRWLTQRGLPVEPIAFEIARSGWRFANPRSYRYVGYPVMPPAD